MQARGAALGAELGVQALAGALSTLSVNFRKLAL